MEDRVIITPMERRREAAPASALPFADQRDQVKRFLAELNESADAAEAEITSGIKRLLDDVSRMRPAGGNSKDLAAREAKLLEESARLEHELEEAKRRQVRAEEKLRRLEAQEEALEEERQRTKSQRRRIAAELTDQREANELERRRATAELQSARDELARKQADLAQREAALQRQAEELERRAADVAAAPPAPAEDANLRDELQQRSETIADLERRLRQATVQLDETRREAERLRSAEARLEQRLTEAVDAERALTRSETEIAQLRKAQEELEAELAKVADAREAVQELETLKRLYDESQEDLRDLQRRNASLERLKSAAAVDKGAAADQAMDWESQKKRLLAQLEDGYDVDDSQDRSDRLTIEGTIEITDNMIHEKDREIEELKRRLTEQSSCDSQTAALAEAVDQDEAIRARRAEIDELKRQWEAKCRTAEVELSIERAKLARERTELDEKRAELESLVRQTQGTTISAAAKDDAKKGGGRWLARLGLREQES